MLNKFEYFLAVAEELNMSKAAERVHISHQGISATIKQLEREYGAILFYRTPRLSLTPSGETLVRALRQMKLIEDNLVSELNEHNDDYCGSISLGVPSSRYGIFVPDIVPPFKERYPNVELDVISDFSSILEQKAVSNELDMYISTGVIDSPTLTGIPLIKEHFVLLISNSMLHDYFPESNFSAIEKMKQGVSLKDFEHVPLIQYPPYSRLRHAIIRHAEENNIHLKTAFESNYSISFAELCRRNLGIGIVSNLFIPYIQKENVSSTSGEYVHAFPLNELPYCKMLSLVYRADRYLNRCHRWLIEMIRDVFASYEKNAPLSL